MGCPPQGVPTEGSTLSIDRILLWQTLRDFRIVPTRRPRLGVEVRLGAFHFTMKRQPIIQDDVGAPGESALGKWALQAPGSTRQPGACSCAVANAIQSTSGGACPRRRETTRIGLTRYKVTSNVSGAPAKPSSSRGVTTMVKVPDCSKVWVAEKSPPVPTPRSSVTTLPSPQSILTRWPSTA